NDLSDDCPLPSDRHVYPSYHPKRLLTSTIDLAQWNEETLHRLPIVSSAPAPRLPPLPNRLSAADVQCDTHCFPSAFIFRRGECQKSVTRTAGNQSIGQFLSVRQDFFSNPPTNRRLEEAVVVDWSKMMKFKSS
ncbi:hypothetical protein AVEN_221468-1, partial [Araneus ventricosus]